MMTAQHEVLNDIAACTQPMEPILPALPTRRQRLGSDLSGVHEKIGSPDFRFIRAPLVQPAGR